MRQLKSFAALVAGTALTGCIATTPTSDAQFGRATAMARAQQTLNPDASRNTDPVKGLDGKAAKGALDNYRDSFRVPPSEAAQVLTIGVGNSPR